MKRFSLILPYLLLLTLLLTGVTAEAVNYGKPYRGATAFSAPAMGASVTMSPASTAVNASAAVVMPLSSAASLNSYGGGACSSGLSAGLTSSCANGNYSYADGRRSAFGSTASYGSCTFSTSASKLQGGVTTSSQDDCSAEAVARRAWGWGGGIEPPQNAPVGDGILVMLLCVVAYLAFRLRKAKLSLKAKTIRIYCKL